MGTVFARKGSKKLYVGFKNAAGTWQYKSSGLEVGEEAKAREVLAAIERKIAAGEEFGLEPGAAITVAAYSKKWLEIRETRGIVDHPNDVQRLRDYVLPVIGTMKLDEVRPRHLLAVVDRMRANGKAPRTIRNAYSTTCALFRDAVLDELVTATPCVLGEEHLGKIVDKDPEWRPRAIYARDELELLLFDPRVPDDRHIVYGLDGLAALRHGEGAGLRWWNFDAEMTPLGRLTIARSYANARGTKTQVVRYMPVHPVLAEMLDNWKRVGWPAMMGREPTPEDLIVPCPKRERFAAGRMRDKNYSRKMLMKDLAALGLRHRRGHDLRRTMISLARRDGARKDLLEICTHNPGRHQTIDLYSEFEWPDFCAEVAKLRISRPPSAPPASGSVPDPATELSSSTPLELSTSLASAAGVTPTVENDVSSASFTAALTAVGTDPPANSCEYQELRRVVGVEAPGIEPGSARLPVNLRSRA